MGQADKTVIEHVRECEFHTRFRQDLLDALKFVIIFSPFLTTKRAGSYYTILSDLIRRKVEVSIYTKPAAEQMGHMRDEHVRVKGVFQNLGISYGERPKMHEKIALVDGTILWHGSLNIFSQSESHESMLRIQSPELAGEIIRDLKLRGIYPLPIDPHVMDETDAPMADEPPVYCPVCGGMMRYFDNSSMWICGRAPDCNGVLFGPSAVEQHTGTEAHRDSGNQDRGR
ncbi:MAG: hypothetical protein KJ970_15830 [Candidatus Eisenbacteria bacterium]|uniref:PLD phosphodiesterase domain-containing protein n=1 Tax=Eiseniibacteriota bacterium TaxID=2212470 RepID=A0A948WE30_UNCEI|nr:hypothetical protein [Candidatus Eisenbacteria bacterium]MBU1949127.1 hypothetical protein [Candidatus Eisenbacteria bacterium]MBU2692393.1 hypothetical protein [Candidatus Eisenbacteria bacterium]